MSDSQYTIADYQSLLAERYVVSKLTTEEIEEKRRSLSSDPDLLRTFDETVAHYHGVSVPQLMAQSRDDIIGMCHAVADAVGFKDDVSDLVITAATEIAERAEAQAKQVNVQSTSSVMQYFTAVFGPTVVSVLVKHAGIAGLAKAASAFTTSKPNRRTFL